MGSEKLRVLLFSGRSLEAERLAEALAAVHGGRAYDVLRIDDLGEAEGHIETGRFDAMFAVAAGSPRSEVHALLASLAVIGATFPVLVLAGAGDDGFGREAIGRGAQDYLTLDRLSAADIGRAVDTAIARTRFRDRFIASLLRRHSDLDDLSITCGAAELSVAAKHLGSRLPLLHDEATFNAILLQYQTLFERSMEAHDPVVYQELCSLADQLGNLSAGPKDVVALHKRALLSVLKGQPPAKARFVAEEGRYFLCQLMGQLVSFYRNFHWGLGANIRVQSGIAECNPPAAKKDATG